MGELVQIIPGNTSLAYHFQSLFLFLFLPWREHNNKGVKVIAAIFCRLYRPRRAVLEAEERGCRVERTLKCTRVCKHFKLVFRCAAVDCSTAACFRGLLRLRLIVRRQMPSVSSPPPPPPRPPFVPATFARLFYLLAPPPATVALFTRTADPGFQSWPPLCTFDPTVDRSSCTVSYARRYDVCTPG